MKPYCKPCLKILSDDSQVDIYEYLSCKNEDCTVTDIVRHLKIKQPTVSYHLKNMALVGLLSFRKEGKHVYYRANVICPHYSHQCILQR